MKLFFSWATLLLLTSLFCKPANGDDLVKFVRPLCIPEIHYLEISTTSIWNGEPNLRRPPTSNLLKDKYSLLPESKTGEIACRMDSDKILVKYASSRSAGLCGLDGGTRFLVDMWVNDIQILSKVVLADDCYSPGLMKIWYSQKDLGFEGHSGFSTTETPRLVSFFTSIGKGKVDNLATVDMPLPISMQMLDQRINELAK